MADLLAACGPDTAAQLCRRSFRSACDARAGELRACPTPDCPQVLLRAHPGQWQCDCCLRHYCVPCTKSMGRAVDAHEALSCAGLRAAASAEGAEEVMRELLERDLRAGAVHKCPACQLPQGKASGCNHVTCSGCGAHWCWACAQFHASDGAPVYAHQGSCKGYKYA